MDFIALAIEGSSTHTQNNDKAVSTHTAITAA